MSSGPERVSQTACNLPREHRKLFAEAARAAPLLKATYLKRETGAQSQTEAFTWAIYSNDSCGEVLVKLKDGSMDLEEAA